MNTSVVVIGKDIRNSIRPMRDALVAQLGRNVPVVFVLDRCRDGSYEEAEMLKVNFIKRDAGFDGFCAGSARNLGLANVDPTHNVLFLDGDRIPTGLSPALIETAIKKFDLTLLGVKNDPRRWISEDFAINPFRRHYTNNDVFSMGILFSRTAIQRMTAVQHGWLFNEAFDGLWGMEDNFVGAIAAMLEMRMGAFPKSVYLDGRITDWRSQHGYAEQLELFDAMLKKYRREFSIRNGESMSEMDWSAIPDVPDEYLEETSVSDSKQAIRRRKINLFSEFSGLGEEDELETGEGDNDEPETPEEAPEAPPENPAETPSPVLSKSEPLSSDVKLAPGPQQSLFQ
jgi:glycosyltransferase involved in cell wall biosynthesis